MVFCSRTILNVSTDLSDLQTTRYRSKAGSATQRTTISSISCRCSRVCSMSQMCEHCWRYDKDRRSKHKAGDCFKRYLMCFLLFFLRRSLSWHLQSDGIAASCTIGRLMHCMFRPCIRVRSQFPLRLFASHLMSRSQTLSFSLFVDSLSLHLHFHASWRLRRSGPPSDFGYPTPTNCRMPNATNDSFKPSRCPKALRFFRRR